MQSDLPTMSNQSFIVKSLPRRSHLQGDSIAQIILPHWPHIKGPRSGFSPLFNLMRHIIIYFKVQKSDQTKTKLK